MNEFKAEFIKRFSRGPEISFSLAADLSRTPFHILFGPSGAGKSTVLRCLAGLERPDAGTIEWQDETWFDRSRKVSMTPQGRRIGYISQDSALFPHLTALGNLNYRGSSERLKNTLIELLDLSSLLARYPAQLSGGEKQRVALARSLATRPRLLLLDEPFSALDQPSRESLRLKLKSLLTELQVPTLMVTHDRVEAFSLGDCVHLLDRGKVLESGATSQVFLKPSSLRAAEVVGIENFLKLGDRQYAVRAEDVFFSDDVCSDNRPSFPGHVAEIIEEGPLTRVKFALPDGTALVALVPRQQAEKQDLRSGRAATAHLGRHDPWEIRV